MEGHGAVSQMVKGIFRLMRLEAVEAVMLPTDEGESYYTWSPRPPVTSEEGHSGAPRRRSQCRNVGVSWAAVEGPHQGLGSKGRKERQW